MAGTVVTILSYALRIEYRIDEIPQVEHKAGRLIDIRQRISREL